MNMIEWTPEKNAVIREGLARQENLRDIATDLGVSYDSARRQVTRLGLQPTALVQKRRDSRGQRAKRTCLSCGSTFDSEHVGNRICGGCKSDQEQSRHPARGLDIAPLVGATCGRKVPTRGGAYA